MYLRVHALYVYDAQYSTHTSTNKQSVCVRESARKLERARARASEHESESEREDRKK